MKILYVKTVITVWLYSPRPRTNFANNLRYTHRQERKGFLAIHGVVRVERGSIERCSEFYAHFFISIDSEHIQAVI